MAQRHAAEKELVRDVARRYERAATAAIRAKESLALAEAERISVLAEWAAAPGWSAERVGEYSGLSVREVTEALRAAGTRTRSDGDGVLGHATAVTSDVAAARPEVGASPRSAPPVRRGVAFGAQSVA